MLLPLCYRESSPCSSSCASKDFNIARDSTEEATFRVVFEKVFYDCAKNARKAAASRGVRVSPGKPGRRSRKAGVVAALDSESE
jgi:hypothetical protein